MPIFNRRICARGWSSNERICNEVKQCLRMTHFNEEYVMFVIFLFPYFIVTKNIELQEVAINDSQFIGFWKS